MPKKNKRGLPIRQELVNCARRKKRLALELDFVIRLFTMLYLLYGEETKQEKERETMKKNRKAGGRNQVKEGIGYARGKKKWEESERTQEKKMLSTMGGNVLLHEAAIVKTCL